MIEIRPCGYWILWILDTDDTGYCGFWILWILDTVDTGYCGMWILDTVDTGYCGYWILWILDTVDTGQSQPPATCIQVIPKSKHMCITQSESWHKTRAFHG